MNPSAVMRANPCDCRSGPAECKRRSGCTHVRGSVRAMCELDDMAQVSIIDREALAGVIQW